MDLQKEQVWQLAILWVRSNNVLVRYIASRYFPYMSCSSEDIEAEAYLCAYLIINDLISSDRHLGLTRGYFQIAFMKQCIQLGKGVPVLPYDISDLNIAANFTTKSKIEKKELVMDALSVLTRRQRAVAEWTLDQRFPATQKVIAQHFNITVRGVRKVINNAVKRMENSGYKGIRKSITATS